MTKELVREGKLDRAATADALLEFCKICCGWVAWS